MLRWLTTLDYCFCRVLKLIACVNIVFTNLTHIHELLLYLKNEIDCPTVPSGFFGMINISHWFVSLWKYMYNNNLLWWYGACTVVGPDDGSMCLHYTIDTLERIVFLPGKLMMKGSNFFVDLLSRNKRHCAGITMIWRRELFEKLVSEHWTLLLLNYMIFSLLARTTTLYFLFGHKLSVI